MSDPEGIRPESASVPVEPTAPPVIPPGRPPQPGYAPPAPGAGYGAFGPAPASPQPVEAPRRGGAGRVAGVLVAAALVGGAAGFGGAYAGLSIWGSPQTVASAGGGVVTINNPDSVTPTTAVAAKVVPSVVTISVSGGDGAGTGSGVVISEDGYVITNTHVVTLDGQAASPDISVTTADGRIYSARIVGTDPTYDLAVIQLEGASGLTPVAWGDSSALNVGDATIAVGAPLGLANTVTEGIVSALNRSIEIASSAAPDSGDSSEGQDGQDGPFYFDFGQGQPRQGPSETIKIAVIQTDAAINPGNSGGALVDSRGELIGINVAIASAGGASGQAGSIGVGFAIPSSVAQRVAEDIIAEGSATHGLLGATVQPATSVESATITGAYISEVSAGGAADAAGLRAGDIVTRFGDAPITDAVDLTAQVRAARGGETVTVTYVRDGATRTAEVTLGTLP